MATVQSLTKDRILAIEASNVVSGTIDVDGNLILTRHDGSTINAGYVVGPQGETAYGNLTGTYMDMVGGRPRVLIDGIPLPIAMDYTVVNPLLLEPNSRVIVLRLDEFYVLAGQLNGTVPPKPNQVTGIQVLINETYWDSGFVARNRVVFEWNPIELDANGNPVEIYEYQIWSRLSTEPNLTLDGTFDSTPQNGKIIGEVRGWALGQTRQVIILGRSVLGGLSDGSVPYAITPAEPPSNMPDEPSGLTIVTNSGYFGPAGPTATIDLEFDPVTTTEDGGPITIAEYIVYVDGFEHSRTTSTDIRLEIPSKKSISVQVMAVSTSGLAGGASAALVVVGADPTAASKELSNPTLTSDYGNVVIKWDGKYSDDSSVTESDLLEIAYAMFTVYDENDIVNAQTFQITLRTGQSWPRSATFPNFQNGAEVFGTVQIFDKLGRLIGASDVVDPPSVIVSGITADRLKADDTFFQELFVDELTGGRIMVDYLEPNIGESLTLSANESILLLVNAQEETTVLVGELEADIEDATTLATTANSNATAARNAAAVADSKALAAQTRADESMMAANRLNSYVEITPEGLAVKAVENASNYVLVRPTGVSIYSQGSEASYWEATTFVSYQIFTEQINFGNHHTIESGDNRTIIRAL